MFLRFVDLLFPPRESELLVRSIGESGLSEYLKPWVCELESGNVTALLSYEVPVVRACVVETKFHGNEAAAKTLGNALGSYLRAELDETNAYEQRAYKIVPIPLSHERLKERGYNQVEMTARYSGITVESNLLIRLRDTLPQTMLGGRERRQNMRGAFGAARTPDPSITYIILDDVVTTGATIGEAAHALEKAGARDVWALALAH